MSEENVEIVRARVNLTDHPRRRLEERLGLRFPRLRALAAARALALRPQSSVRQAVLRRAVQIGHDAANRMDYEAMFMWYAPDCDSTFPSQLAVLGEPGTRGLDERVRFEQRWRTEWGAFKYDPDEMVDLGDRLLVLGIMRGSGPSSGVGVDTEWAVLFDLGRGQATREQVFFSHAEALKAAGLSE